MAPQQGAIRTLLSSNQLLENYGVTTPRDQV